jgi:hypothetical protein
LKCQLNQLYFNILATNLLASAYGARTIRRLDFLVAVQFTPTGALPAGEANGDFLMPNVRAKRATTAGRQARAGENVPRTARPGLVACRWRSA